MLVTDLLNGGIILSNIFLLAVCNVCSPVVCVNDEGDIGDTEPATDTPNTVTDDRAITTDQIRELINEIDNLTSNQKQKMAAVLMRHQGNVTKKPGKIRDFEYTFQVQGQLLSLLTNDGIPPASRNTLQMCMHSKNSGFIFFVHKIMLYTDNKSLSFLHKCAFTSNRVARWVI